MRERLCPECQTVLVHVQILDNVGDHGHAVGFAYASLGAKRSIWTGKYPVQGTVHAYLCPECGRVVLYAALPSDSLPVPAAEGAPQEAGQLPRPCGE